MHDAMTLEGKGIPTVVLCTDPFLNSAHVHARTFGRDGFLPVGIPHPLGGLKPEAVKDRAESILDEIIIALTQDG
jgi:hypothetical protein